jgi:hypothetical protein
MFFEFVERHCPGHPMRQFNFKQHIMFDMDTSDQLIYISCSGKHVDYN